MARIAKWKSRDLHLFFSNSIQFAKWHDQLKWWEVLSGILGSGSRKLREPFFFFSSNDIIFFPCSATSYACHRSTFGSFRIQIRQIDPQIENSLLTHPKMDTSWWDTVWRCWKIPVPDDARRCFSLLSCSKGSCNCSWWSCLNFVIFLWTLKMRGGAWVLNK